MKKILFFFALVGWLVGLSVHMLSVFDIDVTQKMPFVWVLHIGIFIVWIPTVLDLKKNEELLAYQKSSRANNINPIGFLRIIFKNCPVWLIIIAIGGFFYAVINFMLFAASQPGAPSIMDGHYIISSGGKIIKSLTEHEYHHYQANQVRGFSGHWLAFYGMAAALLYPFRRKNEDGYENNTARSIG